MLKGSSRRRTRTDLVYDVVHRDRPRVRSPARVRHRPAESAARTRHATRRQQALHPAEVAGAAGTRWPAGRVALLLAPRMRSVRRATEQRKGPGRSLPPPADHQPDCRPTAGCRATGGGCGRVVVPAVLADRARTRSTSATWPAQRLFGRRWELAPACGANHLTTARRIVACGTARWLASWPRTPTRRRGGDRRGPDRPLRRRGVASPPTQAGGVQGRDTPAAGPLCRAATAARRPAAKNPAGPGPAGGLQNPSCQRQAEARQISPPGTGVSRPLVTQQGRQPFLVSDEQYARSGATGGPTILPAGNGVKLSACCYARTTRSPTTGPAGRCGLSERCRPFTTSRSTAPHPAGFEDYSSPGWICPHVGGRAPEDGGGVHRLRDQATGPAGNPWS